MDPFLARKRHAALTGEQFLSASDCMRQMAWQTYQRKKTPGGGRASYEQALRRRQDELSRVQALLAENERLQHENSRHRALHKTHYDLLQEARAAMSAQINSKEESKDVGAADSGSVGSGAGDLRAEPPAVADDGGSGGAGEVPAADVPDPGGPPAEHAE